MKSSMFRGVKKIEKPDAGAPVRRIGQGSWNPNAPLQERQKRFIGFIQSMQGMPTYNVPTIDSVTLHYDGPLTTAAVQGSFGTTINPLGANQESPPPGCVQVDTTFAEPGKFQTFALVCAIQWRLDIEPIEFTAKVNSWSAPATGAAKPVSPDMFNVGDTAIATGTLGLGGSQTMTPADLEWGWWQGEAFFHMVRGYNLQWQYGHNFNLLNDTLRYTAFLPSNAQDGSASSSQVDINYYTRRTNDYYREMFDTPQIALTIDRARLGNMTLPVGEGAIAGQSVYRPSRAYELVGATYGGSRSPEHAQGQQRVPAALRAVPRVAGRAARTQGGGFRAGRSAPDAELPRRLLRPGFWGHPRDLHRGRERQCRPRHREHRRGRDRNGALARHPDRPAVPAAAGAADDLQGRRLQGHRGVQGLRAHARPGRDGLQIDFQTVLKSECGCGLGPAGAAS